MRLSRALKKAVLKQRNGEQKYYFKEPPPPPVLPKNLAST